MVFDAAACSVALHGRTAGLSASRHVGLSCVQILSSNNGCMPVAMLSLAAFWPRGLDPGLVIIPACDSWNLELRASHPPLHRVTLPATAPRLLP